MREFDNDNNDIANSTRRVWSSRLGRNLTSDDSRQIFVNVTGFARIIAEWARNDRVSAPTADNDNVIMGTSKSIPQSLKSEQGPVQ
jgi:hypothetical protein